MCGSKLFGRFRAFAKIGRQVQAVVRFPGLTPGKIGVVGHAQPREGGYVLAMEWKVAKGERFGLCFEPCSP